MQIQSRPKLITPARPKQLPVRMSRAKTLVTIPRTASAIVFVTLILLLSTTGTSATSASSPSHPPNTNNNTITLIFPSNNGSTYLEASDSIASTTDNAADESIPMSTTSRTAFRVTTSFSAAKLKQDPADNDKDHVPSSTPGHQLPLEKLFSTIDIIPPNSTISSDNGNSSSVVIVAASASDAAPAIASETTPNPNKQREINTKLSSRLLNHSILHGSDDELDRLVFSQLPEGSKLVLQTVKIVKTDENGNEETMGDPAVTWNVVPINSTLEDEEGLGEDGEELDGEEEEEDDAENDLDQAGSHPKTSEYSTYGSNDKRKTKKDKYFHGQDHAKDHKLTLTDTDGKKVTNYKGNEKGINDFAKSHGNSQSNEGERYKNSKKKNKGRKVTGFKRVYHKEEFQRTEHFYDDEEAKKIAESYGLSDAVEKSKHGEKKDDRKYHGTRVEKTDGEKVKNEHSTKNGHHKGQQTVYKDSDDHNHHSKYRTAQHSGHGPHQHHQHQQHKQQNHYYPQHNYQGAYSHQRPSTPNVGIRARGQDQVRPHSVRSISTYSSPQSPSLPPPTATAESESDDAEEDETPITMPSGPDHSQYDPLRTMFPPGPPTPPIPTTGFVPKPHEMKIFFADRERTRLHKPSEHFYAPNFGPDVSQSANVEGIEYRHPEDRRNNDVSVFYSKMGTTNSSEAYTRSLPTQTPPTPSSPSLPPRIFDSIPEYYSTILKMNVRQRPVSTITFVDYKPESNLISIEKAKSIDPDDSVAVIETVPQHSRPESLFFGNRYTNWVPMESGSSNTERTIGNDTNVDSTETEAIELGGSNGNSTSSSGESKEQHKKPQSASAEQEDITLVVQHPGRPFSNGFPGRPRPTFPFRHSPGPMAAMRGKGHYYGRTIGPNSNRPHPHPQSPNFMDGIMNSVSEFFSRIGK